MTFTLWSSLMSILPIISIFLVGNYFPPSKQEYRPVFQPPGWVFGVVWTYITLVFGFVSAKAIDKSKGVVGLFYVVLLALLNGWLVINSKKWYEVGFNWLFITSCISISYIVYLGYIGEKSGVLLWPMSFWLVVATALNGVIYDKSVSV
jgi:tryptophan-rich sensory protein